MLQLVQSAAPPTEYVPAAQFEQLVDKITPVAVRYLPAAQAMQLDAALDG